MLRSNTEMHGEGPTRMKSGSELSHSSLGICIQLYTYVGKGMDGYTEMLKISPRYYNLLFYILQLAQSMFCTFLLWIHINYTGKKDTILRFNSKVLLGKWHFCFSPSALQEIKLLLKSTTSEKT